jgi:Radial spokehead-like protein
MHAGACPMPTRRKTCVGDGKVHDVMHRLRHVKLLGVTILPPPPEADDEDQPVSLPAEMTEKGPPVLCSADRDARVQGMHAWAPVTSASSRAVKHQVCGVRSLLWPGSVAISSGDTWSNIYVGWGLKRATVNAAQKPPPMMPEVQVPCEQDALPPPPPPSEPEAEEA